MTVLPVMPDEEVLLVSALRRFPQITTLVTTPPGGPRLGTILGSVFPAIRVAQTGGGARPATGTTGPNLQVECWGRDTSSTSEGEASLIARTVDAHIEHLVGDYGPLGRIVGAWRVAHILKQPDTGQARFIVQVGLLIQGAQPT